ncbi:Histone acetyltransferase of the MYST family 1 [Aduncisulcus paluster]|uniref:histone acetyltransferase n=1 Tax=Aduncisulcus paluster TaxID=2918883 RepID=A0ABQ5K6F5_9EUKA|nr:Histone acetyltransferase of the MYST family 1 [Aduncisulcus paluster]
MAFLYTKSSKIEVKFEGEWSRAQIYDSRIHGDIREYYIHFIGMNKRWDSWVPERSIRPAQKVSKSEETRSSKRLRAPRTEEHIEVKSKTISKVEFGKFEISTWYWSPYPDEFGGCEKLYICEFCLSYFSDPIRYKRHKLKCDLRYPPGDEIYRDANVSCFEVDGRLQKVYCQNLCLFAKLFLDDKALFYEVEAFLYYVMCRRDAFGFHLVGYFSKEKESENILSCIATIPCYQKSGYGKMLIAMSYLLAKKEGRIAGPEEPLSDLGLISFLSYWKREILRFLKDKKEASIQQISQFTHIQVDQVHQTLAALNLIKDLPRGDFVIYCPPEKTKELLGIDGLATLDKEFLDPSRLIWEPFPSMKPVLRKRRSTSYGSVPMIASHMGSTRYPPSTAGIERSSIRLERISTQPDHSVELSYIHRLLQTLSSLKQMLAGRIQSLYYLSGQLHADTASAGLMMILDDKTKVDHMKMRSEACSDSYTASAGLMMILDDKTKVDHMKMRSEACSDSCLLTDTSHSLTSLSALVTRLSGIVQEEAQEEETRLISLSSQAESEVKNAIDNPRSALKPQIDETKDQLRNIEDLEKQGITLIDQMRPQDEPQTSYVSQRLVGRPSTTPHQPRGTIEMRRKLLSSAPSGSLGLVASSSLADLHSMSSDEFLLSYRSMSRATTLLSSKVSSICSQPLGGSGSSYICDKPKMDSLERSVHILENVASFMHMVTKGCDELCVEVEKEVGEMLKEKEKRRRKKREEERIDSKGTKQHRQKKAVAPRTLESLEDDRKTTVGDEKAQQRSLASTQLKPIIDVVVDSTLQTPAQKQVEGKSSEANIEENVHTPAALGEPISDSKKASASKDKEYDDEHIGSDDYLEPSTPKANTRVTANSSASRKSIAVRPRSTMDDRQLQAQSAALGALMDDIEGSMGIMDRTEQPTIMIHSGNVSGGFNFSTRSRSVSSMRSQVMSSTATKRPLTVGQLTARLKQPSSDYLPALAASVRQVKPTSGQIPYVEYRALLRKFQMLKRSFEQYRERQKHLCPECSSLRGKVLKLNKVIVKERDKFKTEKKDLITKITNLKRVSRHVLKEKKREAKEREQEQEKRKREEAEAAETELKDEEESLDLFVRQKDSTFVTAMGAIHDQFGASAEENGAIKDLGQSTHHDGSEGPKSDKTGGISSDFAPSTPTATVQTGSNAAQQSTGASSSAAVVQASPRKVLLSSISLPAAPTAMVSLPFSFIRELSGNAGMNVEAFEQAINEKRLEKVFESSMHGSDSTRFSRQSDRDRSTTRGGGPIIPEEDEFNVTMDDDGFVVIVGGENGEVSVFAVVLSQQGKGDFSSGRTSGRSSEPESTHIRETMLSNHSSPCPAGQPNESGEGVSANNTNSSGSASGLTKKDLSCSSSQDSDTTQSITSVRRSSELSRGDDFSGGPLLRMEALTASSSSSKKGVVGVINHPSSIPGHSPFIPPTSPTQSSTPQASSKQLPTGSTSTGAPATSSEHLHGKDSHHPPVPQYPIIVHLYTLHEHEEDARVNDVKVNRHLTFKSHFAFTRGVPLIGHSPFIPPTSPTPSSTPQASSKQLPTGSTSTGAPATSSEHLHGKDSHHPPVPQYPIIVHLYTLHEHEEDARVNDVKVNRHLTFKSHFAFTRGVPLIGASCDDKGHVILWDVLSGMIIHNLQVNSALCMQFDPNDPSRLAVGGFRMITIWDATSGEAEKSFSDPSVMHTYTIAFHPSSSLMATAGDDRVIRLWDVSTGRISGDIEAAKSWVNHLCFTTNGKYLCAGFNDGSFRVIDVHTVSVCAEVAVCHRAACTAVAINARDNRVVTVGGDGFVNMFKLAAGKSSSMGNPPRATRLSPAAVIHGDRLQFMFSFKSEHVGSIITMCSIPFAQVVITGGADKELKLFKMKEWVN